MGVGPSSEAHKAKYNVAVLGAAGGIGQTLSLLMKQSKYIRVYVCVSNFVFFFLREGEIQFFSNRVCVCVQLRASNCLFSSSLLFSSSSFPRCVKLTAARSSKSLNYQLR